MRTCMAGQQGAMLFGDRPGVAGSARHDVGCKHVAALEGLRGPGHSTRHPFKPSNSNIQVLFLDDVALTDGAGRRLVAGIAKPREGQSSRHTCDHKSILSHRATTILRRESVLRNKGSYCEFQHQCQTLAPKSNNRTTKLQRCPISHDVNFQFYHQHWFQMPQKP